MIPYRGSAGRQNTTWRENKSTGIGCRHVAPILQPSRAQSSSGSGGVEAGSRDSAAAAGAKLPPAGAYQQLPDSFWDERRILYNRMRHERDRANRRARLKQLRAAEEARLAGMGPEAAAAYEAEMTALRIEAATKQKQLLAHALQHGLKVIIDCSYCLPTHHSGSGSSSHSTDYRSRSGTDDNVPQKQQQMEQQLATLQLVTTCCMAGPAAESSGSGRCVRPSDCTAWQQHGPDCAGDRNQGKQQSPQSSKQLVAAEQQGLIAVRCNEPAGGAVSISVNSNSSSSSREGQRQRQVQQTAWQRGSDSSNEVRSLAKQVELSVSLNRRSSQPVALTVTSFTGDLRTFATHMGASSWPINKHAEHVLHILPAEQLVLLSPDAEKPLMQLDPDKAYVIGGIVDRSVCKGLTARFGAQHGLETVRLPVLEYADELGLNYAGASKRPLLNVSDVVVALIEYHRTGSWTHALREALPKRKMRGPPASRQS